MPWSADKETVIQQFCAAYEYPVPTITLYSNGSISITEKQFETLRLPSTLPSESPIPPPAKPSQAEQAQCFGQLKRSNSIGNNAKRFWRITSTQRETSAHLYLIPPQVLFSLKHSFGNFKQNICVVTGCILFFYLT